MSRRSPKEVLPSTGFGEVTNQSALGALPQVCITHDMQHTEEYSTNSPCLGKEGSVGKGGVLRVLIFRASIP